MNENAKQWIAALRSGDYEQGKHALRIDNTFCCLGVACDLYQKKIGTLQTSISKAMYFYNCGHLLMPRQVMDWLGLKNSRGSYAYGKQCLSGKNDKGTTFPEIADIIESEPPGLFVETDQ